MHAPWARSVVAVVLVSGGIGRADPLVADGAKLQRARAMRHAGVALSAVGIACEVASIALWASWVHAVDDARARSGEWAHVPFDLGAGAIATSAAVPVFLGAGIPLWSIGARRAKRAAVTLSAAGQLRF